MQEDLISRKALMDDIINTFHCKPYIEVGNKCQYVHDIINRQTSVYDVKNIITKLEEELALADEEKRRCVSENPLQFDEVKGYARGIDYAINVICGEKVV